MGDWYNDNDKEGQEKEWSKLVQMSSGERAEAIVRVMDYELIVEELKKQYGSNKIRKALENIE